MPTLYILRGVSGSGKTTLADTLVTLPNTTAISADNFAYNENGEYVWDVNKLGTYHAKCKEACKRFMKDGLNIILHNTSCTEKEINPYIDMAKEYGYTVVSLVVENRHGNTDVHSVPEKAKQRQANRLLNSIKLI